MLPRPPVYLSVTLRKLCQIWAQVESACPGTFLPSTPTFGSARPLKPGTSPMRLTSCPMRFARYGNFLQIMIVISRHNMNFHIQHCLPDCEETLYKATVSASKFRGCDFKNFGTSTLCSLGSTLHPPMWGAKVLEQFK